MLQMKYGVLLGVSVGFLAGCGGDDPSPNAGTGDGEFSSSVSADKPLNGLDDQEFATICRELDAHFTSGPVADQSRELACRFSGFVLAAFSAPTSDAAAQAACKVAYDQCVATPSQSEPGTCSKPSSSCTATVGEFSTCISDMSAPLAKLAQSLPACGSLTLQTLQQGALAGVVPVQPSTCTALEEKCPDAPIPPSMGETQL